MKLRLSTGLCKTLYYVGSKLNPCTKVFFGAAHYLNSSSIAKTNKASYIHQRITMMMVDGIESWIELIPISFGV